MGRVESILRPLGRRHVRDRDRVWGVLSKQRQFTHALALTIVQPCFGGRNPSFWSRSCNWSCVRSPIALQVLPCLIFCFIDLWNMCPPHHPTSSHPITNNCVPGLSLLNLYRSLHRANASHVYEPPCLLATPWQQEQGAAAKTEPGVSYEPIPPAGKRTGKSNSSRGCRSGTVP